MNTLLIVATIMITLAVLAQAGVLISMYLTSRRLTAKAEALMDDSRKLMAPFEAITADLRVVAQDMTEAGKIARQEAMHLQQIVGETHANIREEVASIRSRVSNTVDEARGVVMRPIREYSAIATGVAEGLRTFFGRKPAAEPEESIQTEIIIVEGDRPAA